MPTIFRNGAVLLAGLLSLSVVTPAESWFKRGDPHIETHLFVFRPSLTLLDRKVAVYPFFVAQGGEPRPPEVGSLFAHALLQEGSPSSVTYVPDAPWDGTPSWESGRWNEARRISEATALARESGFDLLVLGRVDRFYRTAGQGLAAKVTVWLISVQDGAIVWYGAKKADWIRRFPLEECISRLSWAFAVDWRPRVEPREEE